MNGEKLVGAAVASFLVLATGTASTFGDDEVGEGKDYDGSLTGSSARRGADAVLLSTGGSTVLEVERGDDPGAAYEVEVRRAGGRVTEVLLDGGFDVIGRETGD